jgi:hypothetical protein
VHEHFGFEPIQDLGTVPKARTRVSAEELRAMSAVGTIQVERGLLDTKPMSFSIDQDGLKQLSGIFLAPEPQSRKSVRTASGV